MARSIESVFKTALGESVLKVAMIVKVDFTEGILAYSSTIADIEYLGQVYQGFGTLGSVSDIEENDSLDPQTCTLELSGVKPIVLAAILDTDYYNKPAEVYMVALDDGYQVIGTPLLYFKGTVDEVKCTHGTVARINITLADELSGWDRLKVERYTNDEQQLQYPGDKGCEFITEISGKEVIWPARA